MDPLLQFRASPALDGFGLSTRPSGAQLLGNAVGSLLSAGVRSAGFGSVLSARSFSPEMRGQLQLFELQRRLQHENQVFTTLSNVSKTNHETRMAAVRNMRP